MIVRKSFQFRLHPTKKQAKASQAHLDECRWLYNELLNQRKLAYEELDISLSKYQQSMLLPLLKDEKPLLREVHSQVLQNVVDRLDKAFQAFFSGRKRYSTWFKLKSYRSNKVAAIKKPFSLLRLLEGIRFYKFRNCFKFKIAPAPPDMSSGGRKPGICNPRYRTGSL